jgi:short-subunit dehydrogenase
MILVTGSSEGIGYACACLLHERSDGPVLITGRSEVKLMHARKQMAPALRSRLQTLVCDQARRQDIDALIDMIERADVPLEAALLTVGVNPMYVEGGRRLHTVAAETIEATIRTNCTHALLLSAALLGRFRAQERGALAWVGSQAPDAGLPGAATYCATKSFLSGLARSAHNEYARHGVRVHLFHPGVVRTPRTAATASRFAARHHRTVMEPLEVVDTIVSRLLAGSVPSNVSDVEVRL